MIGLLRDKHNPMSVGLLLVNLSVWFGAPEATKCVKKSGQHYFM
jgi:hypothetical protein